MAKEKIGGAELFYELKGDGPETVILLNGIGMTASAWDPVSKVLEKNYRVLLHDFRGQLLSGLPPEEFGMELHAEDLNNLLEHLDITKAHVIGVSYGSEVAMIFACRYPEKVKTLTVVAGVSESDELLSVVVRSWMLAARRDPELFFWSMISWAYSPEYLERNREALEARSKAIVNMKGDYFEGFARLCAAFLRLHITEEIKTITCPTYVISADLDIIKPVKFGRIIHEAIAGSHFEIISGSGHAINIEKPELLTQKIRGFIEGF